ncbi:MAG TPA: hypothetical protein PK823_05700 [Novosphingobium sp.]|nr:hypothetical protein [Novosphingobium sp.]
MAAVADFVPTTGAAARTGTMPAETIAKTTKTLTRKFIPRMYRIARAAQITAQ